MNESGAAVSDDALLEEWRRLLLLQLTSLGADIRRLAFLRWLVEHGHHPEWPQSSPRWYLTEAAPDRPDYSPFQ